MSVLSSLVKGVRDFVVWITLIIKDMCTGTLLHKVP